MKPEASQSLLFAPASYVGRLDYSAMFPRPQPVEVEIGCGDGGFLAQYAPRHPGRNFIGVERLKGRLGKLDRRGQRDGLTNVRLLRLEAGYFVEYLLPPASVMAVHIYFPDPWPKKRHHKNRLIQAPFVHALEEVLGPEGIVYLRTDDAGYFAQMLEAFGSAGVFQPVETPAELEDVVTDFEREFNARGIPTHRAAFRRRGQSR